MKHFISLILATVLLSCSQKTEQTSNKIEKETKPKTDTIYNPKAIELNNKGVEMMVRKFKQDSALYFYNKAIELDTTYYLPHTHKATIFAQRKEYKKALLEMEMAIRKAPNIAETIFFVGMLNEILGNTQKAEKYYLESVEIFNKRIESLNKKEDIDFNKLNLALSKKFLNDSSYIDDLNEITNPQLEKLVKLIKTTSKKGFLEQLLNQ